MSGKQLSIIIPARNEDWLQKTIDDIFEHSEADTEVLVGLDGYSPFLLARENLQFFYQEKAIGQRALMNELAHKAKGKYLMKCDAHVSFSQGFDRIMLEDMEEDITLVPALGNLYVYDYVCDSCACRHYQGVEPKECERCKEDRFHKELVWEINHKPIRSNFVFDTALIFQYAPEDKEEEINETLSIQGSGFMVSRKKYWELGLADEAFGSWGQQGTEVALKTWLSGGKVFCTRKAYMGHFFRTPTGFPYPITYEKIKHAQDYSKDIFLENKWPKQIMPLSDLIEKFKPLPDWHNTSGEDVLKKVLEEGNKFKSGLNKPSG